MYNKSPDHESKAIKLYFNDRLEQTEETSFSKTKINKLSR